MWCNAAATKGVEAKQQLAPLPQWGGGAGGVGAEYEDPSKVILLGRTATGQPLSEPDPSVLLDEVETESWKVWQQFPAQKWRIAGYVNHPYFAELRKATTDFILSISDHVKIAGKNVSLVEVGCGTGELVRDTRGAFQLAVGVDFNRSFIEFCRDQASPDNKLQEQQLYVLGDACELVNLLELRFQGNQGTSFWDSARIVACVGNTIGEVTEELRSRMYQQMVEVTGESGVIVMGFFNARWFGDACQNFYSKNSQLCGPVTGSGIDFATCTLRTASGFHSHWSTVEEVHEVLQGLGLEIITVKEEGKGILAAARRPVEQKPPTPPKCGLLFSGRFRKSCFFNSTVRHGVKDFTTYNHMLFPLGYYGQEADYEHMKKHVSIWDVAVQRQVELVGPDALKLLELLTPRAMADMKVGQCRYAVIIDEEGKVLNDPVALRLAEDRFWLSAADSDLEFWARGVALGKNLDVKVFEAKVSPLDVLGPKSLELLTELFGEWIADLKYFTFRETELDGIPIVLARSGWSPERSYELYLQDESRGEELWEKIMEAGQKYCIRPGVPNQYRRIEGGMLNFGEESDITRSHNALELGLPARWCSSCAKAGDFIGKAALRRIEEEGGPTRKVVGLKLLDGNQDPVQPPQLRPRRVYSKVVGEGEKPQLEDIGMVTSLCFSPELGVNIGIATLNIAFTKIGTEVLVDMLDTPPRLAEVSAMPFLPRVQ